MARLHHVSREHLLALRPSMQGPVAGDGSWKVAHPSGPEEALPAWFSLTPRSPSIDSRVGAGDVELSATLDTFGGVTGPVASLSGLGDGAEPPPVVLGGNPVPPGTPAGPSATRTRQCGMRLRLSAEGLARDRQCLLLAAVCAMGSGEHRAQLLMGEAALAEDVILGEDRLAVLLEVPDDGRLLVELWIRLASADPGARLGIRGVQGHLL